MTTQEAQCVPGLVSNVLKYIIYTAILTIHKSPIDCEKLKRKCF